MTGKPTNLPPETSTPTPPPAPTTPIPQLTPPLESKPAAQVDDDALVVFETDNPKIAPIIQRANTQAAKYRDARNQTRAELAASKTREDALAARVKELEAASGGASAQIVAFKSKLVDNYLGDALRAAGATQVQVTRLLPSLRADVKDTVKVDDNFSVSGDVAKNVADLAKDFGFTAPKTDPVKTDTPPASTAPTSPGAGDKTTPSAPGAGGTPNTNPLLATFGNRGRNQQLAIPSTDPHTNHVALVQKAARALEGAGWGKQDQLPPPPPESPAALESEPKK